MVEGLNQSAISGALRSVLRSDGRGPFRRIYACAEISEISEIRIQGVFGISKGFSEISEISAQGYIGRERVASRSNHEFMARPVAWG